MRSAGRPSEAPVPTRALVVSVLALVVPVGDVEDRVLGVDQRRELAERVVKSRFE